MKKEVKIELAGLKIGMYVSRLDRPWIETPFLLEGLLVESIKDINDLKKACKYVYVDLMRGREPHPKSILTGDIPLINFQDKSINPFGKKRNVQTRRVSKKNQQKKTPARDQPVESVKSKSAHKRNQKLSEYNGYEEDIAGRRKQDYSVEKSFDDELKTASKVYEKLGSKFQAVEIDIKKGNQLNLDILTIDIKALTESIMRNPFAMSWVAHIKSLKDSTVSRALSSSIWCCTFARHLGLEKSAIDTLTLGGLLLDIGKHKLSPKFLKLPRSLTAAEFRVMQMHVNFSVDIIKEASRESFNINQYNDLIEMVADHHERADASGYPENLKNEDISFFGRIAGIVDSFDAMTSKRSNEGLESMSPNHAVNEIYNLRCSQFQLELVQQFVLTVGIYPTGSLVEMKTGEVGVVIAVNPSNRLRPRLKLILDKNKQSLPVYQEIDLEKLKNDVAISHGLAQGAFGLDMSTLFNQ